MSEILGGVMIRRVNYRVIGTTGLDVGVGVARGEKWKFPLFGSGYLTRASGINRVSLRNPVTVVTTFILTDPVSNTAIVSGVTNNDVQNADEDHNRDEDHAHDEGISKFRGHGKHHIGQLRPSK